jgi:hypothetical protein
MAIWYCFNHFLRKGVKMCRRFSLVLVAVFLFPTSSPAETIWSYYPLGLETERHEIISSCNMSLCFYNTSTGTFSPEILHETVTAASQGQTFTATAQTDPNFNDFLGRVLATNNNNDLVCVRMLTNSGTDLSTGTEKSVVFSGCPPLTAGEINDISLTLNIFKLETPGNDIWHDGKDTYFSEHITLALKTPEPSCLVLLVIALVGAGLVTLRRRSRCDRSHSGRTAPGPAWRFLQEDY